MCHTNDITKERKGKHLKYSERLSINGNNKFPVYLSLFKPIIFGTLFQYLPLWHIYFKPIIDISFCYFYKAIIFFYDC